MLIQINFSKEKKRKKKKRMNSDEIKFIFFLIKKEPCSKTRAGCFFEEILHIFQYYQRAKIHQNSFHFNYYINRYKHLSSQ